MSDPEVPENKDKQQASSGQLPLELPDDLPVLYTNLARISHTPSEIVFDFSRFLPGQPRLKILSRVVMAPVAAKLFLRALAENLARYEATFGEIKVPGDSNLAGELFRHIRPPE